MFQVEARVSRVEVNKGSVALQVGDVLKRSGDSVAAAAALPLEYVVSVRDGARIKYKLMGFMVYF
jgi:hypothetical protein